MAVPTIRSLWLEHVAELTNEFEVNRRLASAAATAFTQPAILHQMNKRSTDDMGDNNNTDNYALGYACSSYMKANPVENQNFQAIYPPSVIRAPAKTYKKYQGYPSPLAFSVQLQRKRI